MLEFYTEEFKKRANKQINEISNLFRDLLPNLKKWQMRGCMVLGKDLTTYYIPVKNEEGIQIGTKITIFSKITGETYLIVSLEESLKYRKTTKEGEVETYNVFLEDNKLYLQNIWTFDNDFVIYSEVEKNGNLTVDVSSNLGGDLFKDKLIETSSFDKMKCIKDIYFEKKPHLSRVRKKDEIKVTIHSQDVKK